ncbi:MAG: hypothetical protein ACTSU5_21130 [Promethearchaeota archaeon]
MSRHLLKVLVASTLLALLVYPTLVAATAGPGNRDWGVPEDVNGNAVRAWLRAGEPKTFKFSQTTQLRFNSNINLDLDVQVDVDDLGDVDFALELENEAADLQLKIICNGSDEKLGLQSGNEVIIEGVNRYRYGYQNRFMFNASLNGTIKRARLHFDVGGNSSATWAYYNETSGEWEIVPSSLEGDYLVAEVTHFSVYSILYADETSSGDIGTPASALGLLAGAAVAIAVVTRKRRK